MHTDLRVWGIVLILIPAHGIIWLNLVLLGGVWIRMHHLAFSVLLQLICRWCCGHLCHLTVKQLLTLSYLLGAERWHRVTKLNLSHSWLFLFFLLSRGRAHNNHGIFAFGWGLASLRLEIVKCVIVYFRQDELRVSSHTFFFDYALREHRQVVICVWTTSS